MSNSANTLNQGQNQKQQSQKNQYSNQANTGPKNEEANRKVGNNIEKDEPRAGGMKDKDEGSCSTSGNKSTQGDCN